jgi:hypothetical protein
MLQEYYGEVLRLVNFAGGIIRFLAPGIGNDTIWAEGYETKKLAFHISGELIGVGKYTLCDCRLGVGRVRIDRLSIDKLYMGWWRVYDRRCLLLILVTDFSSSVEVNLRT